jgi:hypothetical protein
MKPSPQFIVYMVGIALLGLFYGPVKAALGGEWLFLVGVICYLLALRLVGNWVARVWAHRRASHDT